jgi:hypothetical protein
MKIMMTIVWLMAAALAVAATAHRSSTDAIDTFSDTACQQVVGKYNRLQNMSFLHDTKSYFFAVDDTDHGSIGLEGQEFSAHKPRHAARQVFGAAPVPFWGQFWDDKYGPGPVNVQYAWLAFVQGRVHLWEAAAGETRDDVLFGLSKPPAASRKPDWMSDKPLLKSGEGSNLFRVTWTAMYENMDVQQCAAGRSSSRRFYGIGYNNITHAVGCFRPLWPIAVTQHADEQTHCQQLEGVVDGVRFESMTVRDIRKFR